MQPSSALFVFTTCCTSLTMDIYNEAVLYDSEFSKGRTRIDGRLDTNTQCHFTIQQVRIAPCFET